MVFSTPVPVSKQQNQISYGSEILSVGSCFAVNMADRFGYFRFRNTVNPTGILFHPIAIENLFADALANREFTPGDMIGSNGRWHCFDAHSDMSGSHPQQVADNLNTRSAVMGRAVSSASHIILTLGTAWAYRHKTSGRLVANCHKIPQHEFAKELLSVDQIKKSLTRTIELIANANAAAQVIFTVSPVRHIKDGLVENQRSKAHLIAALHELLGHSSQLHYFPAFEIMVDELRDYRFYADDMLHPSRIAIDFIWEKFLKAWVSEDAFPVMDEVEAIMKGLAHRPFDADGAAHRKFEENLDKRARILERRFPFMAFPTRENLKGFQNL